jgi:hypothetical protein
VAHENRCLLVVSTQIVSAAVAQQPQPDASSSPTPQTGTPLPGINVPAVTRSARASKIIGANISRGNTSIGKIDDVLVDLDHSTVSAVVLSVGGFLGMGDKLVPVPADQIKVSSEGKIYH